MRASIVCGGTCARVNEIEVESYLNYALAERIGHVWKILIKTLWRSSYFGKCVYQIQYDDAQLRECAHRLAYYNIIICT